METFRSKVDAWFVLTAGVVVGVGAGAALAAATAGTLLLPALLMLPAVALVLWIWRSTRYVVTDTSLLVHCGLSRTAVPLADITALRRAATALSAPALSLDRLEVRHSGGAVVISPAGCDRFVAAVAARNPLVDVAGVETRSAEADAQFRRQRRMLSVGAAAVVILVTALVAALHVYELPPPDVTVGSTRITVESGGTRMAVSPDEITSLTLEETLPPLEKRFGWGSYTSMRGRFNTERASGWVHVSRRRPPFIVLETANSFLILNDPDPEKTREAYAAIAGRWRTGR